MNDDALLIEATLAGDSAAFGRLVLRYQDRLYNTVFRFLGSAEDSRDVVQDAFVQAFVKLDTFEGTAAFYTWLYRIAFNLAVSLGRRRRPTASLEFAKDAFGCEPIDQMAGPETGVLDQERADMVHKALAQLNDEHRQILVLREMEGCSYDQISEILGVPVGTVRSRLFRARLQMREHLSPLLGEELGSVSQSSE